MGGEGSEVKWREKMETMTKGEGEIFSEVKIEGLDRGREVIR